MSYHAIVGPIKRAARPRVLRGGAFDNESRNLRATNRNRNQPENRNQNIGFRCVLAPRRQHATSMPIRSGSIRVRIGRRHGAMQDPAGG